MKLKTCKNGHTFYKSSDCHVCPECEKINKNNNQFPGFLSSPAKRALINANILSEEDLAGWKESDILKLHGIGPSSLPKLKAMLQKKGYSFKTE